MTFTIILFLITVLEMRASGLRFRILTPVNNTLIGSATGLLLQLEENALNSPLYFPPSIVMNGTTLTFSNDATGTNERVHLFANIYDCFLSQSIFVPGFNRITISLYASYDSITPLYTENLHLFSKRISPYDSHFDSLIEYTRSKELNNLSYMVI